MEQFIGCDAHKKYSIFVALNGAGEVGPAVRVLHDRVVFREFPASLPAGSPIALEAGGSYYWMVDERTAAGHDPHLAHPADTHHRLGGRHKTDEREAAGLGRLLLNGTLPEVWIPPSGLRDQRELLRRLSAQRHLLCRAPVRNRPEACSYVATGLRSVAPGQCPA